MQRACQQINPHRNGLRQGVLDSVGFTAHFSSLFPPTAASRLAAGRLLRGLAQLLPGATPYVPCDSATTVIKTPPSPCVAASVGPARAGLLDRLAELVASQPQQRNQRDGMQVD